MRLNEQFNFMLYALEQAYQDVIHINDFRFKNVRTMLDLASLETTFKNRYYPRWLHYNMVSIDSFSTKNI